jgi:hypothetical protein
MRLAPFCAAFLPSSAFVEQMETFIHFLPQALEWLESCPALMGRQILTLQIFSVHYTLLLLHFKYL